MLRASTDQFRAASLPQYRAPRIALPRVDGRLASHWSRLAGHDLSGALALEDQTWRYEPLGALTPDTGLGTVARVSVGGEIVQLAFSRDISNCIGEFAEYFEEYETLEPGRLALVVEHFLSAEIAALEEHLGAKIELMDVELASRFNRADSLFGWRLTNDAIGLELDAFIDADDRAALVERLANAAPRRPKQNLAHLKVSVSVLGPIARISAARLARLEVGAVFFPDSDWCSPQQLVRYVGWTHNIMPAIQEGSRVKVVGEKAHASDIFDDPTQKEAEMASGIVGGKTDSATTAVVSVELAQEQFALADLEELRDGVVLELSVEHVEEVTLTSGGRAIAQGRLVQLDQSLGVQITRVL